MSYSQMFQRPVQAGWPSIWYGLELGHVSAKTTFFPSYDTSGSETSPRPLVMAKVTLCSGALGEDFSRIIRSPPGALGAALVGLIRIAVERIVYAIGTSPVTVTVADSLPEPWQPARPRVSRALRQAARRLPVVDSGCMVYSWRARLFIAGSGVGAGCLR
jgi:hypothetical protein